MELFYTQHIEQDKLFLSGGEALHCAKVMRHSVGDEFFAIDGKGLLYQCRIVNIFGLGGNTKSKGAKKRGESIEVEAQIVEKKCGIGECNYNLTIAVCPTKNLERYEWFVEKATEVGIERIVPIISGHSIRSSIKQERIESIVLSATKQSLKAFIPKVEEPIEVKNFIAQIEEANKSGSAQFDLMLIAHCEEGEKTTIRRALEELGKSNNFPSIVNRKPNIAVMIGPEGDFTKEEIALAQKAGFRAITLGESRLRVETAALAAVFEIYFAFN